jgi:hypothetical protein
MFPQGWSVATTLGKRVNTDINAEGDRKLAVHLENAFAVGTIVLKVPPGLERSDNPG